MLPVKVALFINATNKRSLYLSMLPVKVMLWMVNLLLVNTVTQ